MFDKQYRFRGRHAVRVDALTSVFDSNSKAKLFDRNVDVYANAPLVGFLYGRTAEQDDTRWERARMLKYKSGTSSADLSFKAEMCLGHKADRTQAACFSSVK